MREEKAAPLIEKHYRWNFTVNVLDGAKFWFGMSFVSTAAGPLVPRLLVAKEPAVESTVTPPAWVDYLRSLPSIIRRDHNFRRFLITQCLAALSGRATLFQGSHFQTRLVI